MKLEIKTIRSYVLLYKLTKQVNYLRQARKLANELALKGSSELTVFILKPIEVENA
jgi:hypothetical protein